MSNFLDTICSNCGDADQIDVVATVWLRLTPDGTDADASRDGSHDYTPRTPCICQACGHSGRLAAFERDGTEARQAAPKEREGRKRTRIAGLSRRGAATSLAIPTPKGIPMRLNFPWSGVAELLDELRRGTETRPTLSGQTAKGLWLVGDHGVYLMANTVDGPRAKARPPNDKPFVAYAVECNPATQPFDVWWATKQATFGGDDGCDLIPLADIDRMLNAQPDAAPVNLSIDFSGESFAVEIAFRSSVTSSRNRRRDAPR
jgi:hypothetical protein